MGFTDMNDDEFSEYCKIVSAAYFAEEDEMKAGIHPAQVIERIEKALHDIGYQYKEITFLDWNPEGPKVRVSIDDTVYGIFNYSTNEFEVDGSSDEDINICISEEVINHYFSDDATDEEIQDTITKALEMYFSTKEKEESHDTVNS